MMELLLFQASALLYLAATAAAFVYLDSREPRWSRWMLRLLGAGAALHLASFACRLAAFWAAPDHRFLIPIHSLFGALSFMSLAVALTFFAVEVRHRLGILGAFVLPWACAGSVAAFWRSWGAASTELGALGPSLQSGWMNLHPVLLMSAYALLANAFGVGLALLVQENQIKSRRPSELCYRLPAIDDLDRLHYALVFFAFPVLAAGILSGGLWAHGAWGRFWGWDAKETWALITAVVYASYLHLRGFAGWRGRKTVYMAMAGFACALFTFIGVNFMSRLHDYL